MIKEDHHTESSVSVILPVFNGELFIRGAINSVLEQTFSDWELLIIDDGSTDTSGAICEEYSANDARIKVFHQANGGVNSARARGIDFARGLFLTFLDADDALLPYALEYMTNLFREDIDLVAHGTFDGIIGQADYITALWGGKTGLVLWGKMFRTSLFKRADYRLDRRLVMGEDLLLNSIYALNINSALVFSQTVYDVNLNNETSVTRTFKHNWDYEKFFFGQVEELFLNNCREWDSYQNIELLVNKSWLNAMKYVMLDGNSIQYDEAEFKNVQRYFIDKKDSMGPSEKLIFTLKNPWLYRFVINTITRVRRGFRR